MCARRPRLPCSRRLLLVTGLAAVGVGGALGACGTTAGRGGGAERLPVSGAGPFRRVTAADHAGPLSPPFVLADARADLDDPCLLADGARLSLWVTARRDGREAIERADAPSLDAGFGPLAPALAADQPWEAGGVSGPAVVAGAPVVLVYAAGGALGYAVSSDGRSFVKGPGPTLVADPGAGESTPLERPGAVRLGDRVRVYYASGGAVWAADAPLADLVALRAPAWRRLDGDPGASDGAARHPMLAATSWPGGVGRVFARAAPTPAGRLRHDLYVTALGPPEAPAFASSYDGERFAVAAPPLLSPPSRAPTETPLGDGALLLFAQPSGNRSAIAAALSP